jgi:hypothetical protein
MYILINKSNMTVVAKHTSANALLKLAWLELPHEPVAVCGCGTVLEFDPFTDLELKLCTEHHALKLILACFIIGHVMHC